MCETAEELAGPNGWCKNDWPQEGHPVTGEPFVCCLHFESNREVEKKPRPEHSLIKKEQLDV